MVGLVIVSHSHALVTGLQELVAQMVPDLDNIAFIVVLVMQRILSVPTRCR